MLDVSGRELRRDVLGALNAGDYAWTWNGRDGAGNPVASGIYFARLVVGRQSLTQKAIWLAR